LEHSGFFGARFRENAGRALLLPRGGIRQRLPLWLNRLRAKKLLAAVSSYGDFPIVLETWRTCLRDELDIEALRSLLDELSRGEIEVSEAITRRPSPFAAQAVYRHTNAAMYEDDRPLDPTGSRLQADLVREVVFSGQLRPRIDPALTMELVGKLHRTQPGYAPRSALELVEWTKERLLLDEEEWSALLASTERDHGEAGAPWLDEVATRVVRIDLGRAAGVCAVEDIPRLCAALGIEEPLLSGVAGASVPAGVTPTAAAEEDGEQPGDEAREALLVDLVGQWLGFYGPIDPSKLAMTWGLSDEQTRGVIEALEEAEQVVVDSITDGCETLEVCDADNLERLLRLARARARPPFEARPIDHLPLFFATHQGLVHASGRRDDLGAALEKLLGFPAPASSWEADLLPARLDPYTPAWLDRLLQESELSWIGCGKEKLTFAFPSDLDLLFDNAPEAPEGADIFPAVPGRFNLTDLSRHSGRSSADLSRRLWELAWSGRVTNDTFAAVRRGIQTGFEPAEPTLPERRRGRPNRRSFSRWQSTRPFVGSWLPTELEAVLSSGDDPLEAEERNKERVRLLLARYGVLFRELVARELPALGWSRIFRALRLMELSGEVLTGRFFCGVPGPQFASHAAFRRLQAGLDEGAAYWMSAVDPASPCGLGLEGQGDLPHRRATTTLSFVGTALVLVSRRNGRELVFSIDPEDDRTAVALAPLETMLTRELVPVRGIDVETINDEPAASSRYRAALAERFEVSRGPRTLRLERRYAQPPSSGMPTPTRNSK
jgi:ATP-dependent Lhr-like helicase